MLSEMVYLFLDPFVLFAPSLSHYYPLPVSTAAWDYIVLDTIGK